MFEFKRNHIIVTVLVFMIAIAAYLSFTTPDAVTPNVTAVDQDKVSAEVAELPMDKDFFNEFNEMETLPPDMEEGVVSEQAATQKAVTDETVADALATDQTAEVAALPEQEDIHSIDKVQDMQVTITKKEANQVADNSVLVSKKEKEGKTLEVSYFLEEKMLREQSRAAQVEQLTEYVANEKLDKETKAKAAENLLLIQDRIEKESGAESLLRAKGFKDVFVRMDNDTVDVVVNKTELTDEEVAQIEEIVHRKTGYSVMNIKITPLNLKEEVKEN